LTRVGSTPVRVRFAPSPTGSLHIGNALSAVANRVFADEHGGTVVLRIDDTDPARVVAGGEEAIFEDLTWLDVRWDDGPYRQSDRGEVYAAAAERVLAGGALQDPDRSIRLDGTTLVRADGTATYQLATVVDDIELGITHVIRGSDHRPNEAVHRRIAAALGAAFPEVIHHGLILGDDGKKLSKRHGQKVATLAELRAEGIPGAATRAYLEELGLPRHDVRLDLGRIRRLAVEAIQAMPDGDLAATVDAPIEIVPALRGARTLVEAAGIADQILATPEVVLSDDARPTLDRFAELRSAASERVDADAARAIVRELKAVGGDLKALRLALTGAERGPELAAVVAALPRGVALARAAAALRS
jgi:tRNA synthetases class I (E and Q), catalytic domain